MSPDKSRRDRPPVPALLVIVVACLSVTAAAVTVAASVILTPAGPARPGAAAVSATVTGDPRANALLARMPLAGKLRLLEWVAGRADGPGTAAVMPGLPGLGIPPLHLVTGIPGTTGGQAPALPPPLGVAATFSQQDAAAAGAGIGRAARVLGDQAVALPLASAGLTGGWAGTAYGQEPLLAAQAAAAEVAGIQGQGTMAVAEGYPPAAMASAAALHQVYLAPFQAAIQAGLAAIMCSPAAPSRRPVPGAGAAPVGAPGPAGCSDPGLLMGVLRDELGFGGFVTAGWGAKVSALALNAGLDMAMGGGRGPFGTSALEAAIKSGSLNVATVDRAAGTVLAEMDRFGLLRRGPPGPGLAGTGAGGVDPPPHGSHGAVVIAAAGQAVQDAITLLKNSRHALPLTARGLSSLALIAPGAGQGGGGAAGGLSTYRALRRDLGGAGVRLELVTPARQAGRADAVAAARKARAAIVFAGGTSAAASRLPGGQDALIRRVAAANRDTIVVLSTPGPVALPWLRAVRAVVETWYPGGAAASATASVLLGRADPAGKLPVAWPARAGIRGRAPGNFSFGYGLSYTSFRYSRLRVTAARGGLIVRFLVANTGRVAGEAVPQVYLGRPGHPPAGAQFPAKALAGYARIGLRPGQRAAVTVRVPARELQYWNQASGWATAAGPRLLYVGPSERVAVLTTAVTVPG